MKSYVIGFILSLIFTFIPYYLVVNQTFSSKPLLVIIVAIGLIQMLIQVTFFLHLGRGPKPDWNLYFYIGTFGLILVVVGGSILIMNNLHYNMSLHDATAKLVNDENIYQIDGQQTGACQKLGTNHQVTIKDGIASPLHTNAAKCDTLTFINEDSNAREIAFGDHPAHDPYAGKTDLRITKGHNQTLTLSETGAYKFHDHFEKEIAGDFNVAP